MKYLVVLLAVYFFSCSQKPVVKGYYGTLVNDTTKYIGHMHYSDNFKHDTSFRDTVFVIRTAKDSLVFWVSDFYLLQDHSYELKRIYSDFKITPDNLYNWSYSASILSDDMSFRFHDNDQISISKKLLEKEYAVYTTIQKYRFDGERYIPKTKTSK